MSGRKDGRRSVSMRPESYAKLTAYAEARGISRSAAIEAWIVEHVGEGAPKSVDVPIDPILFARLNTHVKRLGVPLDELVDGWVRAAFDNTLVENSRRRPRDGPGQGKPEAGGLRCRSALQPGLETPAGGIEGAPGVG